MAVGSHHEVTLIVDYIPLVSIIASRHYTLGCKDSGFGSILSHALYISFITYRRIHLCLVRHLDDRMLTKINHGMLHFEVFGFQTGIGIHLEVSFAYEICCSFNREVAIVYNVFGT